MKISHAGFLVAFGVSATAQTIPYTVSNGDNVQSVSLPGFTANFSFLNNKQIYAAGTPTALCDATHNLGSTFSRNDAGAQSSTLYVCAKTGSSSYGWDGPFIGGQNLSFDGSQLGLGGSMSVSATATSVGTISVVMGTNAVTEIGRA